MITANDYLFLAVNHNFMVTTDVDSPSMIVTVEGTICCVLLFQRGQNRLPTFEHLTPALKTEDASG